MGKKKNRKTRRGGLKTAVRALVAGSGWLLVKLIPGVLLLSLVIFTGFEIKKAIWEDRFLTIQEVKIIPPDVLSSQSEQLLESKLLGKNIFMVDLKGITSRIELGPGAQSVRAVRELPSTIRIEIQKRQPVANVRLSSNGPYAIVAEDHYIIDVREEADPAWILIEDYSELIKFPKVGLRIQHRGFSEALQFMKLFRKRPLSRTETVTRIKLDRYGEVTVRLGEGPDFQLGRKPSERMDVLEKAMYLFKTEPREQIEYMDLKYDRFAVKKKS